MTTPSLIYSSSSFGYVRKSTLVISFWIIRLFAVCDHCVHKFCMQDKLYIYIYMASESGINI